MTPENQIHLTLDANTNTINLRASVTKDDGGEPAGIKLEVLDPKSTWTNIDYSSDPPDIVYATRGAPREEKELRVKVVIKATSPDDRIEVLQQVYHSTSKLPTYAAASTTGLPGQVKDDVFDSSVMIAWHAKQDQADFCWLAFTTFVLTKSPPEPTHDVPMVRLPIGFFLRLRPAGKDVWLETPDPVIVIRRYATTGSEDLPA